MDFVPFGAAPIEAIATDGGSRIAAADGNGRLSLWVLSENERKEYPIAKIGSAVHGLLFSGGLLLSAHENGTLKVWNLSNRSSKYKMVKRHTEPYALCEWKGMWVAVGDYGIDLWCKANGWYVVNLTDHKYSVTAVEPAGEKLLTGGENGEIRIWDTNTQEERWIIEDNKPKRVTTHTGKVLNCVQVLSQPTGPVWSLRYAKPDCFYSAHLGTLGMLYFWQMANSTPVSKLYSGLSNLCDLAVNDRGDAVYANACGRITKLGETRRRHDFLKGGCISIYLIGERVVAIGEKGIFVGTMDEPLEARASTSCVTAYARNKGVVVIGGEDGKVTVVRGLDQADDSAA